jgi:hypothetical protein
VGCVCGRYGTYFGTGGRVAESAPFATDGRGRKGLSTKYCTTIKTTIDIYSTSTQLFFLESPLYETCSPYSDSIHKRISNSIEKWLVQGSSVDGDLKMNFSLCASPGCCCSLGNCIWHDPALNADTLLTRLRPPFFLFLCSPQLFSAQPSTSTELYPFFYIFFLFFFYFFPGIIKRKMSPRGNV